MKRAIAWFAGNHVAANLLMLLMVIGGLLTLPLIPLEVFPELETDLVTTTVEYPGAAPQEVEEGICVRLEEELDGVEGIKRLRSMAVEGVGVVTAELLPEVDTAQVLDEIKSRVDAIETFPDEAEKPIVSQVRVRRDVLNVAVSGEADERTLKALGERVRDDLSGLAQVTHVELVNVRPYEISVEVSEAALRRHGITFDDVARAVRRSSLDVPGGSVKTAGGEILLRSKGQAYRGPEFERIVVLGRPDGTRVTLGEVGRVVDGFEETDRFARFDGAPAALVKVYRVGDQNALEIARAVKGYVSDARETLPAGIALTVWQDESEILQSRLNTLLRNARSGFLLVLAILALFLRPRLAFWVSIGIPISFLGALWLLPTVDVTINVISLFAFILVLGIVVDDAIVVGENVHTHRLRTRDRLCAAVSGAQEVAIPVIFGVLTTVAAFVPMLLVPGTMGQVIGVIGIVVIACLVFSILESQLVLPAHLARSREEPSAQESRGLVRVWRRFQERFSARFEHFVNEIYRVQLERVIGWRYAAVSVGVSLLLVTGVYVGGGWIDFTFFPAVESDNVVAFLSMPEGTPVEETAAAVRRLEAKAQDLGAMLDDEREEGEPSIVRHVLASIGEQPYRRREGAGILQREAGAVGGHLGEVNVALVPYETSPRLSAAEFASRWRELTGPIPGAVELVFSSALFSAGEAIHIQLRGERMEDLRGAADRVKAALAEYPGVTDIADSFRAGQQEVQLSIRPTAETLDLTVADLGRQVRQAFYGEEAQRIQRGRDDVRVMVRYPAEERRSLGDLENMRIRAPGGAEVPFWTVARAEFGRGYSTINRTDRRRIVSVTADVDVSRANANEVLADLRRNALPAILADYRRVTYSLEGEQREQRETLGSLGRLYLIALFSIYTLLAIPLRSYSQPLIIMAVIPFGMVGAVAGHVLTGYQLSMMSMIGAIALSGVVVNSSLVLIDYINRRRAAGLELERAVREASVARFRPILLTALTTFAGLTPLMLERSLQARVLIPMAVSLAFGVIFAAAVSLFLLPCAYLILQDLRSLRRAPAPPPPVVHPAARPARPRRRRASAARG